MISLNGMELDPYLQIPNLDTAIRSLGNERVTMGGRTVVQRIAGAIPREMTLTAVNDGGLYGRFFRSQVQAIRAMADAGTVVVLVYHSLTVNVVVALDGVQLEMIGHRTDPPATHPYVGTVTLLHG